MFIDCDLHHIILTVNEDINPYTFFREGNNKKCNHPQTFLGGKQEK